MTIKDINAIDFANFLRKRSEALKAETKGESTPANDEALVGVKAKELRTIAYWAAGEVFGEDTEKRKAFLRMAGV